MVTSILRINISIQGFERSKFYKQARIPWKNEDELRTTLNNTHRTRTDGLSLQATVDVLCATDENTRRCPLTWYWQHYAYDNKRYCRKINGTSENYGTTKKSSRCVVKRLHRSQIFAIFFSSFEIWDRIHSKNRGLSGKEKSPAGNLRQLCCEEDGFQTSVVHSNTVRHFCRLN